MTTLAQQYLTSFARRADQRLAALTRALAGALAGGDEEAAAALTYEGRLLSHGLISCADASGALSPDERVYLAGKLLPLLAGLPAGTDPATRAELTLALDALAGRVRGQADPGALTLSGSVTGLPPAGSQLVISRDGVQLRRQPAAAGPYLYLDQVPGTHYRVELTGTGLSRELVRPLTAGVLFGVLPHGASPAQLARLPVQAGAFAGGPAGGLAGSASTRFSFVASRERIYLCVPVALGRVLRLTQPDDQDAEITAAFTRTQLSLDFGPDGTAAYEVLENNADFIGAFTLDAHL